MSTGTIARPIRMQRQRQNENQAKQRFPPAIARTAEHLLVGPRAVGQCADLAWQWRWIRRRSVRADLPVWLTRPCLAVAVWTRGRKCWRWRKPSQGWIRLVPIGRRFVEAACGPVAVRIAAHRNPVCLARGIWQASATGVCHLASLSTFGSVCSIGTSTASGASSCGGGSSSSGGLAIATSRRVLMVTMTTMMTTAAPATM